jgi:hypothetical protein
MVKIEASQPGSSAIYFRRALADQADLPAELTAVLHQPAADLTAVMADQDGHGPLDALTTESGRHGVRYRSAPGSESVGEQARTAWVMGGLAQGRLLSGGVASGRRRVAGHP